MIRAELDDQTIVISHPHGGTDRIPLALAMLAPRLLQALKLEHAWTPLIEEADRILAGFTEEEG